MTAADRAVNAGLSFLVFIVAALACGGSPPAPDLQAEVRFRLGEVVVKNTSADQAWSDVEVTLNGTYTYKLEALRPGQDHSINLRDFTKDDGTRFNSLTVKVNRIFVMAIVNGRVASWAGEPK